MIIAATYENGNIFQHFGRTENFKLYTVEDGKVISAQVISSGGTGHGALAGLLKNQTVDVLICGGIGAGAQNALANAGIELCSGAQGDADAAVEAYLKGELKNAGSTCDHHDGEHSCGHQNGDHACGGSCHDSATGGNTGKTCRVHYRGTFNDGTQFDSSYDRGEPLEFVCGAGMMISGFDRAVAGMQVGQIVDVHLMPEEAYGMPDPAAILTIDVSQMPGSEELKIGDRVYLYNTNGQPIPATVTAREGSSITFDANSEMAGKELNFKIELLSAE